MFDNIWDAIAEGKAFFDKTGTEAVSAEVTGYVWLSAKTEPPKERHLCVICHYNGHKEVGYFDGVDWWEQSNSFSKKDMKIDREFWPDWWFGLTIEPNT